MSRPIPALDIAITAEASDDHEVSLLGQDVLNLSVTPDCEVFVQPLSETEGQLGVGKGAAVTAFFGYDKTAGISASLLEVLHHRRTEVVGALVIEEMASLLTELGSALGHVEVAIIPEDERKHLLLAGDQGGLGKGSLPSADSEVVFLIV